MKTNIALIGMMGTSKSTCGKLLADRLDMLFLDVDALIEYEEMPIPMIFSKLGEDAFRGIESKKIERICSYENLVIATGGGVVKREENVRHLRDSCYVVLLTATSEEILGRIKKQKGRPLLKRPTVASIEKLQNERRRLYEESADVAVDTTGLTPEETVDRIESCLLDYIEKNKDGKKR